MGSLVRSAVMTVVAGCGLDAVGTLDAIPSESGEGGVPEGGSLDGGSPDGSTIVLPPTGPPPCVVDVAARRRFTCAALASGKAWCFGDNSDGQLGDGTKTPRAAPTLVGGVTNAVRVATASRMAYALTAAGKVWAWGLNDVGQLGDNSLMNHETPAEVPNFGGIDQLSAGRGHVCARSTAGDAYCWGWNIRGQIGDGLTGTNRKTPFKVPAQVTQVSAGGRHTAR